MVPTKTKSLFFHILSQDHALQKSFNEALCAWAPQADHQRFKEWALYYLYRELKDTYKMEVLECNNDVRIHLFSVHEGESAMFPKEMLSTLHKSDDQNTKDGAEIFLCIQNTEAAMILNIINLINITKVIPDNILEVRKTIANSSRPNVVANEISITVSPCAI